MYDTMEEYWKARCQEANEERYSYMTVASRLAGYYGALAKYDESVPKQVRIRMLQNLIETWEKMFPDDSLSQEWIAGWKKDIERISA